MIAAVVPVQNEEKGLSAVLQTLSKSKATVVIPVLNGCSDNSKEIVSHYALKKATLPLFFDRPLGFDIPRSIGAKYAQNLKVDGVLFMDGDMSGPILNQVNQLIDSIKSGHSDMALTDCYQNYYNYGPLAQLVLQFREKLNREIGVFPQIGTATPAHGPHAVSRRLLDSVPLEELALPPVSLALARKNGLRVKVAASIPHCHLGSDLRSQNHLNKIGETIIGDCIEALECYWGKKRTRCFNGQRYVGYHESRDFTTLASVLSTRT